MTKHIADQISTLLNERNELATVYTPDKVLEKKDNYVFILEGDELIACAEVKQVQWYQWEISHVSVIKKYEGQGKGKEVLKLAEKKALDKSAKVFQCTIRANNENSQRLFTRSGYDKVGSFFYPPTGNCVFIFQKVMSIC